MIGFSEHPSQSAITVKLAVPLQIQGHWQDQQAGVRTEGGEDRPQQQVGIFQKFLKLTFAAEHAKLL